MKKHGGRYPAAANGVSPSGFQGPAALTCQRNGHADSIGAAGKNARLRRSGRCVSPRYARGSRLRADDPPRDAMCAAAARSIPCRLGTPPRYARGSRLRAGNPLRNALCAATGPIHPLPPRHAATPCARQPSPVRTIRSGTSCARSPVRSIPCRPGTPPRHVRGSRPLPAWDVSACWRYSSFTQQRRRLCCSVGKNFHCACTLVLNSSCGPVSAYLKPAAMTFS